MEVAQIITGCCLYNSTAMSVQESDIAVDQLFEMLSGVKTQAASKE